MRKLVALLLCAAVMVCIAGCKQASVPEYTLDPPTYPSGDAVVDAPTEPYHPEVLERPMHGIALPKIQESVTADDGTELFSLSFPKVQLILNGTDAEEIIVGNLQSRMSGILSAAAEIEAQAQADYPNAEYWTPYFIDVSYTPTRIDHAILSLFGNRASYAGGSHPTLATESVTYDLDSGMVLSIVDILESDCTGEELGNLVLDALKPVSDELYYDYDAVVSDMFTSSYSGISQWYFSQTGLCFHFSPYEIAPYSAGTITAEIPYEKLSGILKSKYMPTLAPNATGSMYAELCSDAALERFTFTADVTAQEGGSELLLYSDATVTNLRIEVGTWYSDGSQYVATDTLFAADSLGIGNAIRLTADLSQDTNALRLVYHSADQEVAAFIILGDDGQTVLLAHG